MPLRLQEKLRTDPNIDSIHCVIRNPWDRLVSAYLYKKGEDNITHFYKPERDAQERDFLKNDNADFSQQYASFLEFVTDLPSRIDRWISGCPLASEDWFFAPQYTHVRGIIDDVNIQRLEDLGTGIIMSGEASTLELKFDKKMRINNDRTHYSHYYNVPGLVDIVRDIYAEDIALGNYCFEREPVLIAHRGNTEGRKPERENCPIYIQEALDAGFDAEVDVRYIPGKGFYLGHDISQYPVDVSYLRTRGLWVHAKDAITANALGLAKVNTYFLHSDDDYVLTSSADVWIHPDSKTLPDGGIYVHRGDIDTLPKISHLKGVCSDYVQDIRGII